MQEKDRQKETEWQDFDQNTFDQRKNPDPKDVVQSSSFFNFYRLALKKLWIFFQAIIRSKKLSPEETQTASNLKDKQDRELVIELLNLEKTPTKEDDAYLRKKSYD